MLLAEWGSLCGCTTSQVLLENFQKSSITSLQADTVCDASEIGPIYTEGVLLGLAACLTPVSPTNLPKSCTLGTKPYLWVWPLATRRWLCGFWGGAVGDNGGLRLLSLPRGGVESHDLRRDTGMQWPKLVILAFRTRGGCLTFYKSEKSHRIAIVKTFPDVRTMLHALPHSIHSVPFAHLLWVSHDALQFATFLSCLFIVLSPH